MCRFSKIAKIGKSLHPTLQVVQGKWSALLDLIIQKFNLIFLKEHGSVKEKGKKSYGNLEA